MAPSTRRLALSAFSCAAVCLGVIAAISGCSHDWDALDPTGAASATSTTAATTVTSTTSASVGGGGGAGGSTSSAGGEGIGGHGGAGGGDGGNGTGGLGQGDCPTGLKGPALVRAQALGGGAYCVDATEVTNFDYDDWLSTAPPIDAQAFYCDWNTDFHPPGWPPPASEKFKPIVSIDWCDAVAYCGSVGKRLCGKPAGGATADAATADPKESAWFNACSAGGTLPYPYGDSYKAQTCNGGDLGGGKPVDVATLSSCVGGEPGLFDMSGNVWEWENACVGYNDSADTCAVRGGDFSAKPEALTCDAKAAVKRSGGGTNIGFRCCADALP